MDTMKGFIHNFSLGREFFRVSNQPHENSEVTTMKQISDENLNQLSIMNCFEVESVGLKKCWAFYSKLTVEQDYNFSYFILIIAIH